MLPQAQKTPLALHAPWLTHTLAGLFVFAGLALIILLAVQTTRQEGLGSSRVESYRMRPGMEQQLARLTGMAATLFVITATLVSLTGI